MPVCYEEEFTVYQFECDPWNRMKPGAMLRRVQEIGTAQSEALGLDEEMYNRTHTVFMLSRISLEVYQPPVVGQKVTIQTRAYGPKRAVYYRVTSILDENGNKLCEADSRWVLVDTETRRILRKEPEGFVNPFAEEPQEEHDMDMPSPGKQEAAYELLAGYSICDVNRHINNTHYADILCDCLPIERLESSFVKKMLLFFRTEIGLGERFKVSRAQADEHGYYFQAEMEGKKVFEGYARL